MLKWAMQLLKADPRSQRCSWIVIKTHEQDKVIVVIKLSLYGQLNLRTLAWSVFWQKEYWVRFCELWGQILNCQHRYKVSQDVVSIMASKMKIRPAYSSMASSGHHELPRRPLAPSLPINRPRFGGPGVDNRVGYPVTDPPSHDTHSFDRVHSPAVKTLWKWYSKMIIARQSILTLYPDEKISKATFPISIKRGYVTTHFNVIIYSHKANSKFGPP